MTPLTPPPYESWYAVLFDVGTHLLMLHIFFTATVFGVYDSPLWTLALEEQLYALYQPFLWFRRRLGVSRTILLVAGLSITWQTWAGSIPTTGHSSINLLLYQAPARWLEWCLGAWAAEAYFGGIKLPAWSHKPGVAAITLILGCAYSLLWGIGFFILLNRAMQLERTQGYPKNWAADQLARIGLWSYSLYLLHTPLMNLGLGVLIFLHLNRSAMANLVFLPTLALMGSWVFFYLVERHFLNLQRRSDSLSPAQEIK
ncbi:acyltransferase [bacterium CPR1]|nr:acyltransferase [bacterium CPR1]